MKFVQKPTIVPPGPPPELEIATGQDLEDRVRLMFGAIAISIMDPYTLKLAYKLASKCKANDEECEVGAVFDGLRDLFEYRGETRGFDVFRTLRRTVETGSADCDCASIALASVLSCLEYRVGVRTVIVDTPGVGKDWGHVYALTAIPKWGKMDVAFPLDLGVPRDMKTKPGWETKNVFGKKDFWFVPEPWIAWYTGVNWNEEASTRKNILAGMPRTSAIVPP